MHAKNTICLWYDKDAEEAANFYAATFPDSEVTAVHKAPSDFPGGKGTTNPDLEVAKRVFEAMMTMKKIDIAAIKVARRG